MFFENILFFILKNKKQKIILGYQMYFLCFLFRIIKIIIKNNSQIDSKVSCGQIFYFFLNRKY